MSSDYSRRGSYEKRKDDSRRRTSKSSPHSGTVNGMSNRLESDNISIKLEDKVYIFDVAHSRWSLNSSKTDDYVATIITLEDEVKQLEEEVRRIYVKYKNECSEKRMIELKNELLVEQLATLQLESMQKS